MQFAISALSLLLLLGSQAAAARYSSESWMESDATRISEGASSLDGSLGDATTAISTITIKPSDLSHLSSSYSSQRSLLDSAAIPHTSVADIRKLATAMDPEMMQYVPTVPWDTTYKNPCWRIDATEVRCVPYLYVGGSFQAGAQDFLSKLIMHPDIIMFWGEEKKKFMKYLEMNQKGIKELNIDPANRILLDGSMSTFSFYWAANLRSHQAFQEVIVPCHGSCPTESKDDCLMTKCYPEAMKQDRKVAEDLGLSYDLKHMPVLMSALYHQNPADQSSGPVPKFIFVLRNPLERLHTAYWSHPHYRGKYGENPQGFLKYVTEQIGAVKNCYAPHRNNTERDCALYFEALGVVEEVIFFHADQVMRGMYSIYAEVWLRHFPRNNIMFIRSEEYFADEVAVLKKAYKFVGLSAPADRTIELITKKGKPQSFTNGREILPEARALVSEFYKPWNERLAKLLDDDKYLEWNK
eukprot:gene14904-20953_t